MFQCRLTSRSGDLKILVPARSHSPIAPREQRNKYHLSFWTLMREATRIIAGIRQLTCTLSTYRAHSTTSPANLEDPITPQVRLRPLNLWISGELPIFSRQNAALFRTTSSTEVAPLWTWRTTRPLCWQCARYQGISPLSLLYLRACARNNSN